MSELRAIAAGSGAGAQSLGHLAMCLDEALDFVHGHRNRETDLRALLREAGEVLRPYLLGDDTLERILYGDMPDDKIMTITTKVTLGDHRQARDTAARIAALPDERSA